MEAPEKIYMTPSFGESDNVLLASFSKSHLNFHRDIEYTCTDALIEKACEWLENHLLEYWSQINGNNIEEFIEQFKKAIKEQL